MRIKKITKKTCKSIACIALSAGLVFTGLPFAGANSGNSKWQKSAATGLMQVQAAQTTYDYTVGNSTYTYTILTDDTIKITKYKGTDESIVIPSEIDGKKVTVIGSSAFYGFKSLKNIEIPDGITSIESYAFCQCWSITSLSVPESVTSIGTGAFRFCGDLKEIKLPSNLTVLSDSLFGADANLEYITFGDAEKTDTVIIPETVQKIGNYVFMNCEKIKNIKLPTNLKSIGKTCFQSCISLTGLFIPQSVESIGGGIFGDCDALQSVEIEDENNNFIFKDGILYDVKNGILVSAVNSLIPEKVIVDECTKTIAYSAFADCNNLYEIEIPQGVVNIDEKAFTRLDNLKNIEIPDSVTNITTLAFYRCNGLVSVQVPGSVTAIKNGTFRECNNLKKVILNEGITGIEQYAFYDCELLEEISIPGTVTTVGNSAFYRCKNLKNIEIPEGVTKIDGSAFIFCSSLEQIKLPQSLMSIGSGAFDNCTSLISVELPDNAIISSNTFRGCKNLSKIVLSDTNNNYIVKNGILYNKAMTSAIYCIPASGVEEISIEDGVTTIDSNLLFSGNVKKINIPKSVTKINAAAFMYCYDLQSINVDSENDRYMSEKGILYNKNMTRILCYPAGIKDTEFFVPDTVKTIGDFAFYGTKALESINIPDSVTNIGTDAFGECSGLKEVVIPDSVTSMGEAVFYKCTSLEKVKLSVNITSPNPAVFQYCSNLKEVVLSENMRFLGDFMFSYCTQLTNIVLPDTLTSVLRSAFQNCDNLKNITVPKNVTTIRDYAFGYYYDEQSATYKKYDDFTISGYAGSKAQEYAEANGIRFIELNEKETTDGIKIEYSKDDSSIGGDNEEKISLESRQLTESDEEYSKIDFTGKIEDSDVKPEDVKSVTYEISLKNESGQTVQPSEKVTVKIPVPDGYMGENCKVYYVNEKGKFTNMNAVCQNGFLIFETGHFSTYLVTETNIKTVSEITYGDANGDGKIDSRDAVVIKKYVAGFTGFAIDLEASDVNADGKVDTRDAVKILKKIAGFDVTLGEA